MLFTLYIYVKSGEQKLFDILVSSVNVFNPKASFCHVCSLCKVFSFYPLSAAGGEIFNQCVADNDEAFTEKDVIRLTRQILTGVACLHRNNVVHLDLKVRVSH